MVPDALVPEIEKLNQNLFICASALAQHAALACFTDEALAIYTERRAEFKRRRDFIVPAFEALGLKVPVRPDGAFYVYADISAHADDSSAFCARMLHEANVVLVPGEDFGTHEPRRYVRASYATALHTSGRSRGAHADRAARALDQADVFGAHVGKDARKLGLVEGRTDARTNRRRPRGIH